MKFKFWPQRSDGSTSPRMSKPKEIPDNIGRYLIVNRKHEPDWVWALMAVYRDRPEGGSVRDVLLFDPRQASHQGVDAVDYVVLSQHPDLIVFQGWYDKAQGTFEIQPGPKVAVSLASA
jgi:hypothetical protein